MMMTREDILDYAESHGPRQAADLLFLGGPDGYEGDDYDEVLAWLEEKTDGIKMVCEFVGGPMAGQITLAQAEKLTEARSNDWSKERALGHCVPKAELDDRPKFEGYAGPMWDGVRRGGIAILRYETWDVYDMLSR